MRFRWGSGEVQVRFRWVSGEHQISIWAWHWWTWNLFFLLNLYPLCGLRIFCWLNQSLKTRGRGHSQHSLTPHMRARSTTTTSATWLSPTQEAERLTGWRTNWMGIVYGEPAGISEPRFYKIRWMSVFLDMRNMLNCINLYRFGVWPLIHCLKICKKLLYMTITFWKLFYWIQIFH